MCSMLHIVNNVQITILYTLIEKNVLYTLSVLRIVNSVQIINRDHCKSGGWGRVLIGAESQVQQHHGATGRVVRRTYRIEHSPFHLQTFLTIIHKLIPFYLMHGTMKKFSSKSVESFPGEITQNTALKHILSGCDFI